VNKSKLACQVCHSQAAKSCFSCHVGTDKKGLPYYKCEKTEIVFKIGLNPDPSPQRPYEYVLLRHPPITPQTFDAYIPNGLKHFDRLPTWKMDTPHNIQRITPQNKACNNCHGKARLFLRESDLASWEVSANRKVIVPENRIPAFINKEAD
jgi:thiosulfate/3-mercaptopyruvate sulfurtransferase